MPFGITKIPALNNRFLIQQQRNLNSLFPQQILPPTKFLLRPQSILQTIISEQNIRSHLGVGTFFQVVVRYCTVLLADAHHMGYVYVCGCYWGEPEEEDWQQHGGFLEVVVVAYDLFSS